MSPATKDATESAQIIDDKVQEVKSSIIWAMIKPFLYVAAALAVISIATADDNEEIEAE